MKEYPLVWPEGWPRAKSRKRAAFSSYKQQLTYTRAESRLRQELARLSGKLELLVVSSNMIRDRQPQDPGVACYFQAPGKPMRVIAVDIYDRVEDNIAAIAATIEAMRAIERHGGAQILERAFTGFDALPPPDDAYKVLGLKPGATRDQVDEAYRRAAKKAHPDQGGDHTRMAQVNAARDSIIKQLEGPGG